ncbi:sugar O-acetyltransferase [Niabella terrae]
MEGTQKEKMLTGLPYLASDPQLVAERFEARKLLHRLHQLSPEDAEAKKALFKSLLGKVGTDFHIETPFQCDYGYNIRLGDHFYANFNCTILDCAPVDIGSNVMLAPNVSIFTAGHPIHHEPRNQQWEYAISVRIGDNVWVGGGVIINPGVRIGANTVIGSGSVVTRDIPSDVIAAGNPCRVLKPIRPEDRLYYYKDLKFP